MYLNCDTDLQVILIPMCNRGLSENSHSGFDHTKHFFFAKRIFLHYSLLIELFSYATKCKSLTLKIGKQRKTKVSYV
jgi:hypothetical protein